MNTRLQDLIAKYGTETIIARILEQLQLLALSEDEAVKKAVRSLVKDASCDTEYIYLLCEYTNLMSYVSDNVKVTDCRGQAHDIWEA